MENFLHSALPARAAQAALTPFYPHRAGKGLGERTGGLWKQRSPLGMNAHLVKSPGKRSKAPVTPSFRGGFFGTGARPCQKGWGHACTQCGPCRSST